jgi:hypothetical protein
MRSLACLATGAFLLLVPAAALGQGDSSGGGTPAPGGSPLAPLSPGDASPSVPQEQPQPPPARESDGNALGAMESVALVAIVVVLIVGVMLLITREGRKRGTASRAKRSAKPVWSRKSSVATAGSRSAAGERRGAAKAPPPPPRKRRPKAKRR